MKINQVFKLVRRSLRTNLFARSFRSYMNEIYLNKSPHSVLASLIESRCINTAVDVGANVGQFGLDLRRNGFQGQIYSFEPIEEYFSLLKNVSKKYQPWNSIQQGLSDFEGYLQINVSQNDGLSSSFSKMLPLHTSAFPDSITIRSERVSVTTIDSVIEKMGLDANELMLKIDVQGYEHKVLIGAESNLRKIPLLFMEVSITPLYESELKIYEILEFLDAHGHQLIDIFPGVRSLKGELLQVEIITSIQNLE